MRDYELTLVLDPELSSEKQKKLITKIKKITTDLKGKVRKTDEWGRRDLAYPIKKKTLGYYFFLGAKLPEKTPAEIEKKLKLEEGIIRYLLVRSEKGKEGGEHGTKIAQ